MDKCEYEKEGHCLLNECMYGDFMFIDDSAFNSGRYCMCDDVKKQRSRRMEKNITKQLEEVREDICDHFCKYRDTCDDNCECEYLRSGHDCPLDRL